MKPSQDLIFSVHLDLGVVISTKTPSTGSGACCEFWECRTNRYSYHLVRMVELETIWMKLWLLPERGVGFGHSLKKRETTIHDETSHHIPQKAGRCSLRMLWAANLQDFPQLTNYKGYATSHQFPSPKLPCWSCCPKGVLDDNCTRNHIILNFWILNKYFHSSTRYKALYLFIIIHI